MRNHLEEKAIVSEQILEVIDKLIARSKDIVFGGSIALNAVGLIDRPVKDIDVITYDGRSLKYYGLYDIVCPTDDVKDISETTTDVNGETIIRVGAKINDVNICIFKLRKDVGFTEFKFSGRTIKIQNVNEAILAKRAYAQKDYKSCDKHKEDIKHIDSVIDDLLPF